MMMKYYSSVWSSTPGKLKLVHPTMFLALPHNKLCWTIYVELMQVVDVVGRVYENWLGEFHTGNILDIITSLLKEN